MRSSKKPNPRTRTTPRHAQDDEAALPRLPPSARYVFHSAGAACDDWGLVGWALGGGGGGNSSSGDGGGGGSSRSGVDAARYDYFVFVSSSMRGPFMPPYLRPHLHWTEPFLSRLNDDVKLVAATVSCQPTPAPPPAAGAAAAAAQQLPPRENPRATLGAAATDAEGLRLLLAAPGAPLGACRAAPAEAAYHADAGAVKALLDAGRTIDTLLGQFQAYDWRDPASWRCNGRVDPAGAAALAYAGTWLEPFEAMFVRVTSDLLLHRLPSATKAAKLSEWEAAAALEQVEAAAAAAAAVDAGSGGGGGGADGDKGLAAAAGGGGGGSAVRRAVNATARIMRNDFKESAARYKLPRILAGLVVRGVGLCVVACFRVSSAGRGVVSVACVLRALQGGSLPLHRPTLSPSLINININQPTNSAA